MSSPYRKTPFTLVKRFAILFLVVSLPALAAEDADFTLQDHIGRKWSNEFVSFPAAPAQVAHAKAGHALVKNGKTATPYQLFSREGKARIAFMADLAPFETQAYSFSNQKAAAGPGALVGLGAGLEQPPLHHPDYDFPDGLLAVGVDFWHAALHHLLS